MTPPMTPRWWGQRRERRREETKDEAERWRERERSERETVNRTEMGRVTHRSQTVSDWEIFYVVKALLHRGFLYELVDVSRRWREGDHGEIWRTHWGFEKTVCIWSLLSRYSVSMLNSLCVSDGLSFLTGTSSRTAMRINIAVILGYKFDWKRTQTIWLSSFGTML